MTGTSACFFFTTFGASCFGASTFEDSAFETETFFGSTTLFSEKFDVLNDPDEVIIDFKESRVADMSGIEALNKITERYAKVGKKVHLRHLSKDCVRLLKNAEDIIVVCGGVIPKKDYKFLYDSGVAAIFGPGAAIPEVTESIINKTTNHLKRMHNYRLSRIKG